MPIPTPGKPVRGSRSGEPIMAVFDLLGRRWAMGIVWNLKQGACTFRDLQARCETISPSILNRRLKELREAQLIVRCNDGYCLTPLGGQLYELLVPLSKWSRNWASEISQQEEGAS